MGKNKYTCPFCKQEHDLPDGITATEQIATDILKRYNQMQNESSLPCPRCGLRELVARPTRNALSRQFDITVCDICGTLEAIEVANNNPTPLSEWFAVKELLTLFSVESMDKKINSVSVS